MTSQKFSIFKPPLAKSWLRPWHKSKKLSAKCLHWIKLSCPFGHNKSRKIRRSCTKNCGHSHWTISAESRGRGHVPSWKYFGPPGRPVLPLRTFSAPKMQSKSGENLFGGEHCSLRQKTRSKFGEDLFIFYLFI